MNGNSPSSSHPQDNGGESSLAKLLRGLLRGAWRNGESSARDTLEELIEEREDAEVPIDEDERRLLANILELRDRTIHDVMVPRADIAAVSAGASLSEVINLMTEEGHSRFPVYRGSLDDAIGMVHIKDVLAWRGDDSAFDLPMITRKVLFVSPSMQILELLLEMRVKRIHMALVVDEYGGVDGLATIEDLVEEIVGEIEDEHDRDEEPGLIKRPDGAYDADARATIAALEKVIGRVVNGEGLEDIDTLGGLVFAAAGRVPIKGELITHSSGLEFEILDADPRRIKRLRIRDASPSTAEETETD